MVDYLLFALIIFILILDNPLYNKDDLGFIYRLLKYLVFILGVIHLIGLWDGVSELNKGLVSGVLLIGLTYIYTLATEHTGIEDKIARKVFKVISWLILWLILGAHFHIISVTI